jgi:hypothetical protein
MNTFLKNNTGLLVLAGVGLFGLYTIRSVFKSKTPDVHAINTESIIKTFEADLAVKKALTTTVMLDADAIQAAIYGNGGFGTDEDAIFKVMDKYTTASQVKALFLAYGERYTSGSFLTTGFYKVNICLALRSDLNDKDWARISNKFKLAGLI